MKIRIKPCVYLMMSLIYAGAPQYLFAQDYNGHTFDSPVDFALMTFDSAANFPSADLNADALFSGLDFFGVTTFRNADV